MNNPALSYQSIILPKEQSCNKARTSSRRARGLSDDLADRASGGASLGVVAIPAGPSVGGVGGAAASASGLPTVPGALAGAAVPETAR